MQETPTSLSPDSATPTSATDNAIAELDEIEESLEPPQLPDELWQEITEQHCKYSASERVRAVMGFIATGSRLGAGRVTGIPSEAMRRWMVQPWWQKVMDECYRIMNQQFSADLTRTAMKAAKELNDRVQNGEYVYDKEGNMLLDEHGVPKRTKLTSKRLAFDGLAIPVQQRAIVTGSKERTDKESTQKILKQIRDAFLEIGQTKNVTKETTLIEGEVIGQK